MSRFDEPTDFGMTRCPACGDRIDYCQGHGAIGDPTGWRIVKQHDGGFHSQCNERGCREAGLDESMRNHPSSGRFIRNEARHRGEEWEHLMYGDNGTLDDPAPSDGRHKADPWQVIQRAAEKNRLDPMGSIDLTPLPRLRVVREEE